MTPELAALATQDCRAGAPRLPPGELAQLKRALPGWDVADDRLTKTFRFGNYYETMAFVNAIAYIAHRQDHHPDLSVHYNRVVVAYSTHDAGGITRNDCICAAKLEALAA
ncbi:MAG TPA: 4a-hydroxytetrahydrobiopterin dehydratase [Casimicrobiaceae bacterium]|nr:4a-hydroxytetrahydrobiopterin dehydratase [Casimicrobiaceae bacterium]